MNLPNFKREEITLFDLIDDTRKALDNELYILALMMTFSLISACANIKYPTEWFKENAKYDEYLKVKFSDRFNSDKTEWKNKNNDNVRFEMFVDTFIGNRIEDEKTYIHTSKFVQRSEEENLPKIDGEILYKLRCNLVHNARGTIGPEDKIKDEINKKISPQKFLLSVGKQNKHCNCVDIKSDNLGKKEYGMIIDVVDFVEKHLEYIERFLKTQKSVEIKNTLVIRGD